jgi:hypothetical protein
MRRTGRQRRKEFQKRPAEDGKQQQNEKKILNSGNKPKDLLQTNDLAFFGAKNKPNFEPKKCKSKRKSTL